MARPTGSKVNPLRLRNFKKPNLNLTAILGIAFVIFAFASSIALASLISKSFKKEGKAEKVPQSVGIVPTVNAEPTFDGQMSILFLGSDQRPNENGYRTDAILLVVLDSAEKSVSVVSFPRDLWVQVPDAYEMKINQVFELVGFEGTAAMFDANFGIKPDYFLMSNFKGFMTFIDNRGGIDVNVGQDLTDDCDLPQQVDGDCTVLQGTVHMDGPTALWYVRSRNTSSDLDRLRREQEVVLALVRKIISFKSLSQFSEMKTEVEENIQTNMSIDDAFKLIPFVSTIVNNSEKIHKVAISEEQATPSWSWNGMWILLPDTNAIRALMEEVGINLN